MLMVNNRFVDYVKNVTRSMEFDFDVLYAHQDGEINGLVYSQYGKLGDNGRDRLSLEVL